MQTIEARAILSAADRTGGIFSQIAAKIRGMNAAAVAANRQTAATGATAAAVVNRASSKAQAANAAVMAGAGRILAPAAAVATAGKAYKNFSEADLAITRIGITADASREEVKGLGDEVRRLGQETGQSFKDVTKGLESLVAGGMDLKEAMPALPAIAKTAQAAGAEVEHMATTTLALNQNLKISTDKMQNAFDILVKGGKAGKFELKDMAQYFPSIAPAAVAIGMKGEEGLMRIVAALQTIRAGTGTTEEAAASMQNIFAKMESEETTKKFKEMGVDLRKEMAKARKEGKDLLEVFVGLSDQAIKGDLSKVPQLFSDMQVARGMRALLSYKELNQKVMSELRTSAGSTAKDLERVLEAPAIATARLKGAMDGLMNSLGKAIDTMGKMVHKGGTSGILTQLSQDLDDISDNGLRSPKREEEWQRWWRKNQIEKLEPFAGKAWQGDRAGMMNPQTAEAHAARLRIFELKNAENIGTEIGKELFTEWEKRDFVRHLETEGPMPPGKKTTPMPEADPRKGGIMPEVQSLELPPVEVKAEFEPAKVETKVTVEAGSELLRIVDNVKELTTNLRAFMSNSFSNGAGSTGVSSPDARPSTGTGGIGSR